MYVCMYLLNKYLYYIYIMLGIVLGIGDIVGNSGIEYFFLFGCYRICSWGLGNIKVK